MEINNKVKGGAHIIWWMILCVFVCFGIYLRLEALNSVQLGPNEWFTRDMDRALNIIDGQYFPLAGPESGKGGRLPGPFMYFFLAIPLILQRSYESIFIFNFALNIASLFSLFFILKRYFGSHFSIIATSLFSISVHHISAVNHPINPVFIFPFIIILVGLFLELVLKNNARVFPWLVLLFSLSVQFHYSIIIFIVVLFIIIYIFKIQIPKRAILTSIIIALICFLPFSIYKLTFFEPDNIGDISTFGTLKPFSFFETVKIITVQNEISRITNSLPFYPLPPHKDLGETKELKLARHWGLFFIFTFLLIYIFRKNKEVNGVNIRAELFIFLFFYIPALIYEFLRPLSVHYWYAYVYILPTLLVLSWFAVKVLSIRQFWAKTLFCLAILTLMGGHSLTAYKQISGRSKMLRDNLIYGTYKNSNLLTKEIMKKLSLNPREYYDRVFFLDYRPSSINRLEFAFSKDIQNSFHSAKSAKKPCYFIFDFIAFRMNLLGRHPNKANAIPFSGVLNFQNERFHTFKNDSTIKIKPPYKISFENLGFPRIFNVFEYYPIYKQSCYNNSFNPFGTQKNIRDIYIQSKGLRSDIKILSFKEKYDSDSSLTSLEGKYIIRNSHYQRPFKLTVKIFKENMRYVLRGKVESIYFWGKTAPHLSELNINIFNIQEGNISYNKIHFATPALRIKKAYIIPIHSKNTLVTKNTSLPTASSNQEWFREWVLPKDFELNKNKFYLDLTFEMKTIKDHISKYVVTSAKAILNFKKPTKEN